MTSSSIARGESESTRAADYSFPIAEDRSAGMAVAWLWLGVLALLGAGIFSLLLVVSRAPFVGEMFPLIDLFQTSLVVHVDLSILVWFLAFGGVLWSLSGGLRPAYLSKPIWLLVVIGTLTIVASTLVGGDVPLMVNYIPILNHPLFLSGLMLFGLGMLLQVLTTLSWRHVRSGVASGASALQFGMNCAAVTLLFAFIAFAWSYIEVPDTLVPEAYFELLFWGGGHTLQFTYTLLMMVCWLMLSTSGGLALPISGRVATIILLVGFLPVLVAPIIYLTWATTDVMHREMFIWLMAFGGSIGALPLGLAVYIALLKQQPGSDREAASRTALITSMLLFAAGGLIGFMIEGSNVTIPAHYHGSIIGITLALMGVSYELAYGFGFERLNFRLARLQLWGYALGQLLHVLGLVWSGGYGVQRKVAGADQMLDSIGRIAGMGLMGIGGLLSAIGGFMFVVLLLRALTSRGK